MNVSINSPLVGNKFHESERLVQMLRNGEVEPRKHIFVIQHPSGNSEAIRFMGVKNGVIRGRNLIWDNLAAEQDYDGFHKYLLIDIKEKEL